MTRNLQSLDEDAAVVSLKADFDTAIPTLRGWADRVLGGFCGTALAAITVVLLAQVVMRYMFKSPLVWADEVTRILMVWLTFVGAVLGYRTASHIGISTVIDAVRAHGWNRVAKVLPVVVEAVVLAGCTALLIGGVVILVHTAGHTTPALQLPMALLFLPAPLSGALVLVSAVGKWIGIVKGSNGRDRA